MTDTLATVEFRDGIALLTIDNPPVNALSHALRKAISACLATVRDESDVTGLVLACAGRTFVAGADISELGQVNAPMLRDVIAELEALAFPTVAAIHGKALGGGFELSLGCRFRVAAADAAVGLPEVKLGLLPGAGGTVRATYLAGAEAALGLAGSGEPMPAAKARDNGLVDAVFDDGDLIGNAMAFLRARIAAGDMPPPVSKRGYAMPKSDPKALEATQARLARKGSTAAIAAVADAVRGAETLEFDAAMKTERALFEEALKSDRFGALRHVFFAERTAARVEGAAADAKPRPVSKVGVIGAGTMGAGIAMAFANSGFTVTITETSAEALERGLARVADTYAGSAKRGSISTAEATTRRERISGAVGLSGLAGCDLVIEAAFEDMDVKKQIFGELGGLLRPGAVLATNTSYLDVNEIAQASGRPDDVLGMHFFSPANVMKLVEIVRGDATAPDVLATALDVARRLRKQPVVVGVCRGFVGNRMLVARNAQLSTLLLEGASPAEIDAAFRDFGWPMGPCQMQDLAGLDISWRNRKSANTPDALPDRMCELGRFGQKTGKGWYVYPEGGRTPVPDPEVDALIAEMAAERGIERRAIDAAEIIERTHGPMVDEGRRILAEGIAARSSDIDVIWVHGYGFPRDLGGPMYWDDNLRTTPRAETKETDNG